MLKEAEDKYKEYLDENRKRTQSKVQEQRDKAANDYSRY